MQEKVQERILGLIRSNTPSELDKGLFLLYQKTSPALHSFFSKMGVQKLYFEDLVQDTVVVAYRKMREDGFVLTSTLSTFIFGIGRNLALMHLRKNAKEVSLETPPDEAVDEFNVIEYLSRIEKYKNLHHLIHQLGSQCKQVLTWFYFEELSMKEIAKRSGYSSEQVAKNKKSACLKKLRERMVK